MRLQKGINNSKVRDVLRNHGAGTYILQVLEKAKLYSFSLHPFSISMRVGSAPSSAPIIQKTVRPVNRPPFPLLREGFTCIPLQKMVPTSIPLKSLVTPLYHRVFLF